MNAEISVQKGIVLTALAGVSAYFGELAIPIAILCLVMAVDYITGMIKASVNKSFSSKIGKRGALIKFLYLVVVIVAAVADWMVKTMGNQLDGIVPVPMTVFFLGLMVIFWLINTECFSILENIYEIGVPFPPFLMKVIKRMKVYVDGKPPDKEDKAE